MKKEYMFFLSFILLTQSLFAQQTLSLSMPRPPINLSSQEMLKLTINDSVLSPNDAQAYIIYNQAMQLFSNQELQKARNEFITMIRRYPQSQYTPYALYILTLLEEDYRKKIQYLSTIISKFPDFLHRTFIWDRLGDIYYILGSIEAAQNSFNASGSPYALYMQGMLALDARKPKTAIQKIQQYLKTAPDKKEAYQAYLLYAEALFLLKQYSNALTILEKAIHFRTWAYDNGMSLLLSAGQAFYYNNQYAEALYTFSLLRLKFQRSSESKIADQYLAVLGGKNIVKMTVVPWIEESFNSSHKTKQQTVEQQRIQQRANGFPMLKQPKELYPILQQDIKLLEDEIPEIKEESFTSMIQNPIQTIVSHEQILTNKMTQLQTNYLLNVTTNINIVENNDVFTNIFLFNSFINQKESQTNMLPLSDTEILTNLILFQRNRHSIVLQEVVPLTNNIIVTNTKNYTTAKSKRTQSAFTNIMIIPTYSKEYNIQTNYSFTVQTNISNFIFTNTVYTVEEKNNLDSDSTNKLSTKNSILPKDEIQQLENNISQLSEQAAGIAGNYGVTESQGYIVRVVLVKDLSVANIIIRDLNIAQPELTVGIFFKDGMYSLEIKDIPSYEKANHILQTLQSLGYQDAEVLQLIDVTEYQAH